MMWLILSWTGCKVRQLTQQDIQFHSATLNWNLLDTLAPQKIRRRSEQLLRSPRISIRDHNWSKDTLTTLEDYTWSRYDLPDGNAGRCDRSCFTWGVAEVERDHAHPAFGVAPHARHSAEP